MRGNDDAGSKIGYDNISRQWTVISWKYRSDRDCDVGTPHPCGFFLLNSAFPSLRFCHLSFISLRKMKIKEEMTAIETPRDIKLYLILRSESTSSSARFKIGVDCVG